MYIIEAVAGEPKNKHQQKTEATRSKLLAAALRVFSRDGFERSRLEDIAAEAGHTRGAFYAHFATKDDIFIALLEHQASKRVAEISRAVANVDPKTGREVLRTFYVGRAKDRQWSILILEFKLYALRHNESRARFAAAHQRIRESFHVQIMNSVLSATIVDAQGEKYAKVLLEVILNGLLLENAYDPKRVSTDEVKMLLGRMFDVVTLPAG